MVAPPAGGRGFPMPTNKYWGGSAPVVSLDVGVVPTSGATHLDTFECTGPGLATCLNTMASYKDMWECKDEGTAPFNYYMWCLMPTTPVDKYPVNGNMKVGGASVRGHVMIIKLDNAPSATAAPVNITQGEVDALVAANPV